MGDQLGIRATCRHNEHGGPAPRHERGTADGLRNAFQQCGHGWIELRACVRQAIEDQRLQIPIAVRDSVRQWLR